ncbi:MAG: hypothetical protein V7696_01605 [Halioglobus sp.]
MRPDETSSTAAPWISDKLFLQCCCLLAFVLALAVVWKNTFLPMQDLPQHLFMAWVANNYEVEALKLAEIYELRGQLGPYRITYLLQRLFSTFLDPLTAAKLVVTLYLLTVALLVLKIQSEVEGVAPAWASVLLIPASFHPMYFYGFMSFTLAVPVLVLLLLDLRALLLSGNTKAPVFIHCVLVAVLFLIHPYTLLVYLVLATVTTMLLARNRQALYRGVIAIVFGGLIFLLWMLVSAGTKSLTTLDEARLVWWPLQLNVRFLEVMFSGLRMPGTDNWQIPLLWLSIGLLLIIGSWSRKLEAGRGLWLGLLAMIALLGFFLLPFSVQTQERFTFFSVRLAPISLLLLLAAFSLLHLHVLAGRAVAVAGVLMTFLIAQTHDRVAKEVEYIAPLISKMQAGGKVLPLISNSRSAFLDPGFYAQFHYHDVFYYHLLKGGGANPDLFGNRLMPVVYQSGQRPSRPSQRELYRWPKYAPGYDYIISRSIDPRIELELERNLPKVERSGSWRLYRVPAKSVH